MAPSCALKHKVETTVQDKEISLEDMPIGAIGKLVHAHYYPNEVVMRLHDDQIVSLNDPEHTWTWYPPACFEYLKVILLDIGSKVTIHVGQG